MAVSQVVESFMIDKTSFTALDVTKKTCEKIFVKHADVREYVRGIFRDASACNSNHDYMTSIIQVTLKDGSKANSVLYHHTTYSPDDYLNRNQSFDGNTNVAVTKPLDTTTDNSVDNLQPTKFSLLNTITDLIKSVKND